MMRNLLPPQKIYLFLIALNIALLFLISNSIAQTTQQFNSSGTFTVPAGVTSIKVEVWGGGGAGGRAQKKNSAGGGGAGGSFAASVINTTPSTSYTVTVGAAKVSSNNNTASNNNGNPSWFGSTTTVYAVGGPGGAGSAQNTNGAGGTGSTTGCFGTIKYAGGNGSTGNRTSNVPGGAGGGGSGSTGNGGNANAGIGGTGTPLSGGNGANGVGNSSNGAAGASYGGGGSGGKASNQNRNGGTGAAGLVKVTYLQSITGTLIVCVGANTTLSNTASGGIWSSGSPSVATINSSTGVVTAISAGTSLITYSVPSGITGANLTVTATITVLAQPTAPTIGAITQPTCFLATGSIVLNGLPSSGWTVTRYPGGVTTSGSGTSTTIYGLDTGTYSFSVTNASGCTSVRSANAVIDTQPVTPTDPTIGTITQPTCSSATGSVLLSDLPASGTWTLTRSPGGVTTSGSGTSATISGLPTGTYSFIVANSSGCTSIASDDVVINGQPPTPSAPIVGAITQPTCSLTSGSVVLSGLPSGVWTINPVNITGSGQTAIVTGLTAGTYNFTVTNEADCTSLGTSNVVINPSLPVPSIPSQMVDCSEGVNEAKITITGPTGPGLEYSLNNGTYQSEPIFLHVGNGTQVLSVRNSSGCVTVGSNFLVNCDCVYPPTINLSSTAGNTCGTTPITISGNTFENSDNVYITSDGAGTVNPSSTNTSSFSFTYTPAAGDIGKTVKITLTSDNPNGTPCTPDVKEYSLTVNALPASPSIGTITQPTCAVQSGSVVLTGLPSSGNWTIIQSPGGSSTTGSGGSKMISGLAPGNYTFTVTDDKNCTSPSSGNVVINSLPTAPASPTASVTVQPTCAVGTGTVVIISPAQGTGYEYSIIGFNGGVYQASSTFSGVAPGTRNVYVRRTSDNTCISSATSITVNTQPSAPTAPTASVTVQPICAVPSGTIEVSDPAQGSGFEYSIGGAYQVSATFTGVLPGMKSVTVRKIADNTCISQSTNVTVNVTLGTPTAPTVSVAQQPTCDEATGVIVVGSPGEGTGFEYSVDGSNYQGNAIFFGVSSGIKNVTVRRLGDNTCVSSPTSVTVNAQPPTPPTPVLNVTYQSCTQGTITVTSPTGAGYTYVLTRSSTGVSTASQSSTVFSGLSSDDYIITATNSSGCSSISDEISVNPTPVIDEQPISTSGCAGSIASFSVSTNLPEVTYQWQINTSGNNWSNLTNNAPYSGVTTDILTVSGLTSDLNNKKYRVVITRVSSSCSITSDEAILTVTSCAPTASNNGPVCAGGTLYLYASTVPGATYSWSGPGSFTSTQQNPTRTNVTTNMAGDYSVTAKVDKYTSPSVTTNVIINAGVPSAPTANNGSNAVCNQITANWSASSGAASYRLDVSTVNTFASYVTGYQDLNVGNVTTYDVTGLTSGTTYYYRVRAVNGCGASASSSIITYATLPATPATPGTITGATAQCPGLTGQTYSIATVANATTYNWTVPTGWSITAGAGTTLITVTTGTAGQNGSITVSAGNSCGTSAVSSLGVTVNPAAPTTPGTITGTQAQCTGLSSQIYSISSVANATIYNWTVPDGWSITAGAGTNSITATTGVAGQNGNITVTAGNSCGTSVAKILAVTVNPATPATPSSIAGTVIQCPGLTNQTYSISPVTNATIYNWTVPTGWSITSGNGTASILVNTGITGQNGVITVTAGNSCGTSVASSLNVTVGAPTPGAPQINAGSAAGCNQITANWTAAVNATSYRLDVSTANNFASYVAGFNDLNVGNVTTYNVTGLTPGTTYYYRVRATNNCGTSVNSGTTAYATTPVSSVASVSGATSLCIGTTAMYVANSVVLSGGSGSWSSSNNAVAPVNTSTGLVTAVGTGTCSITYAITGGCGSVASATASITIRAINTFSAALSAPTLCINTALTPITHTTTGATGIGTASGLPAGVSATWSSGTITITGTPTASGTFNYSIPLSGGCGTVNATGTITVTPANTITLSSASGTDSQTKCINTAITNITYSTTGATGATFSGLPAGVSGTWSGDVVTISGTPTVAGNNNYTVTLTGGCGRVNAIGTINVNALPTAFNVTGGGFYCSGGSGVVVGLSGSQIGVNYQLYKDGVSSGSPVAGTGSAISFSSLPAGTYTVGATLTSGDCPVTMIGNATVTVGDLENPVITKCLPNGTADCVKNLPPALTTIQGFIDAGGVVTDNCAAINNLTITFSDVITPGSACKVTRTYTIKDASNNATTCQQVFSINDTQAPVINSIVNLQASPNTNSCGANLTIAPPADVTEACSLVDEGAYYEYVVGGTTKSGHGSFSDIFPEGITLIFWTVADVCGHVSASKTQTVQVVFAMTDISYDNGSNANVEGSGVKPLQTSTHEYFVDNKTPDPDYSYTWGLFENNGGSPGAAVNSSLYTITNVNAAYIKISFATIPTGNYMLSVLKTKNEITCKKQQTLLVTVVKNTFDTELKPFGDHCQAGETETPNTMIWVVEFVGNGSGPFNLHYTVNLNDKNNTQQIAMCTGTVSNITLSGITSNLVHSSGCSNTGTMPYMQVVKTDTNASKVLLKYTMRSVTATDFSISIQIQGSDQFTVTEINPGNNAETLKAHGVPATSEITTN